MNMNMNSIFTKLQQPHWKRPCIFGEQMTNPLHWLNTSQERVSL